MQAALDKTAEVGLCGANAEAGRHFVRSGEGSVGVLVSGEALKCWSEAIEGPKWSGRGWTDGRADDEVSESEREDVVSIKGDLTTTFVTVFTCSYPPRQSLLFSLSRTQWLRNTPSQSPSRSCDSCTARPASTPTPSGTTTALHSHWRATVA